MMLLQRLKEYADAGRVENMAPTGYKETNVRYVINLDKDGGYLGVVDQAQAGSSRGKWGKARAAPHAMRTSLAIRPKLLADNAEYVLGVARERDKSGHLDDKHRAFVNLVRDCATATQEPTVTAVLRFLESHADRPPDLPEEFDASAVTTFQVEDVLPIDVPGVRKFWEQRSRGEGEGESGPKRLGSPDAMQCLVCGQTRPAVRRLPFKWQRIPNGQPAGLAIISANEEAFGSYGLEESLIAPTCADCGERFSKAANALLGDRSTSFRIGSVVYIFWTRDSVPFSLGGFFEDPKPEEVRALLQAPRQGREGAVSMDDTPFYAAALSASGARVVVRSWIDTTVGQAKQNLRRYFELQRIVASDGSEAPPLKLTGIAAATVRELKDLSPGPPQAILRLALEGGLLPQSLLFQAVQRCRAEGGVNRPRAALIKMVLLSNQQLYQEEGSKVPTESLVDLNPTNRDPAYLCGRLLAVLESIQWQALGDVNATIVDRYYGTASSAPASVFPRLLRGAQPHLSKIRHDPTKQRAGRALENRLMDLMNQENGLATFPLVLNLPEQGRFALGYYHQRAADRAAARARRGDTTGDGATDVTNISAPSAN